MDDKSDEFIDLYQLLGLQQSADKKQVQKAYLKASLKYHPDKIVNHSEEAKLKAEKIFHSIQQANDTLSDVNKRAVYDQSYNARMARKRRLEEMDTTRRLAKEKVEARELQAKKQKLDETEKHNRGLQAAMLRQEGSKLLREAQQTQEAIVQSSIIGSMDVPKSKEATLIVTWSKKNRDSPPYNVTQLEDIFKIYGPVIVVLKKKKALLSFSSITSAYNVMQNAGTETLKEFTIKWFDGEEPHVMPELITNHNGNNINKGKEIVISGLDEEDEEEMILKAALNFGKK